MSGACDCITAAREFAFFTFVCVCVCVVCMISLGYVSNHQNLGSVLAV